MGYVHAGCSNSDLKLQRRCGSLLPLALFCWQNHSPARCLPMQRLAPGAGRRDQCTFSGTRADPPEDAPPLPMPRSVLLINQCSQLCTVSTTIPWSCLVSALEGHTCAVTGGLHGYPCMCVPSQRPFPTSLSSDMTIPPPGKCGQGQGQPLARHLQGTDLPPTPAHNAGHGTASPDLATLARICTYSGFLSVRLPPGNLNIFSPPVLKK